ncbi:MAG TPA: hypothetical protein VEX68_21245 [Bryobacteraceae bacterium]|nr:hypothetical protein [Bryobacteraceae bacterium]
MPPVDLNRRFHEWNEKEPPDPELRRAFGLDDGSIDWEQLLTKRRAVILAEAGSGKSTEFTERTRLTAQSHTYVFHASVEDVGREGLDQALSVNARSKLAAWRQGVDDAWFFIDSVDEAKVAGIKFERVVRKLAEGVHGAEERCHILLSGRVTDWEPRRDLEALKKWLPVSSVISKSEPTPEQELLRILRNERKPKEEPPPNETPFVAIMAQLDRERVRLFAEAAGVPQTEQFLRAIDDADLWHFARRPLDLDWLVRFWQAERRLGTLQEMVERSISERLKEANPDRTRGDDLNSVTALGAVQRIGAAMVFGRQTTLAIPDHEADLVSDTSLDLADILPDWSGDDRIRLLTRPIFDPATFGRARFHNDNDGTVRSYLAARWLVRLREAGLSTADLFRLLFANSYGLEVIKPSLNETAAWLCLWDKDVANEVVRLAPGLLLDAGDSASLSANIRSAALAALLRDLTTEDREWPWWDNDKLRRFAQPDLGNSVLDLWPRYGTHQKASQLLMRLIWLGTLKECLPLVRDVAFHKTADPTLRVFAGKALLEMADISTRSEYAALIKAGTGTPPLRMVWDAILELVPTLITTSDVVRILAEVNIQDEGLDFKLDGPALVERLKSTDLELFLGWLVSQLGTQLGDHSHHPPTELEEVIFPSMAEAALRLLKETPTNDAADAAIDALLRIVNRREHDSGVRERADEALVELHRTAARRRRAFWRVVATLRTISPRQPIEEAWHIEFLGYSTGLKTEDLEWLLADGLSKGGINCRLAVNAAVAIYRSQGEPGWLLAKIGEAVASDTIGQEEFIRCTQHRKPLDSEQHWERKREEINTRHKAELNKRVESWIQFISDLRSDPDRIDRLSRPVPMDQRSDLLNLWHLLDGAGSQSRYAIDSVAPLERIVGVEVAKAVESGLIAHWRNYQPLVRSRRKAEDRNSFGWLDLMGLTGVTLEATKDSMWATKLSHEEARRATEFATLEINRFPRWLSDLVGSHPAEVRTVLHHEITDELNHEGVTFFSTLNAVAHSDHGLVSLLAPVLLEDLETHGSVPPGGLSLMLQIIVNGLAEPDRERFESWGLANFKRETDIASAVRNLAAVFSVNPTAAMPVLLARATALNDEAKTALVDRFLAACFGDPSSGLTFEAITVPPAEIIEQLMLLSFRTNKLVGSRQRPVGVAYQTTADDYADGARSAIFTRFVTTPGSATYHTLQGLQQDTTFPVASTRLRALAEQRAAEDSEMAPWPPSETYAFERSKETAPRTGRDLRSVLVNLIEDMQHDLLHDDFSQAQTLKGIGSEKEVQKWVADRLRLRQGRSFSVEREPHVVEEKEPDVRVRAKATDANVSMEIKVADSWSLTELDLALEVQLCGRYLRSNQGRYGVLLLVHQRSRVMGWEDKAGDRYLSFRQLVDRLQARALAISGETHDSPQAEVAVLDVSGVQPR